MRTFRDLLTKDWPQLMLLSEREEKLFFYLLPSLYMYLLSREIQSKKVLYYILPLPNSNFYSTVIDAIEDKIAIQNS